jgi:hypothetical protein
MSSIGISDSSEGSSALVDDLVRDLMDWQLRSVCTTIQEIQLRRYQALITANNTYTIDYPSQYITGMIVER